MQPEEGGGLLLRTEDAGQHPGRGPLLRPARHRLYRCAEDYASHMTEWISTIQTAQNGPVYRWGRFARLLRIGAAGHPPLYPAGG